MAKFEFYVNPSIDTNFSGGCIEQEVIINWLNKNQNKFGNKNLKPINFAELSEKLILERKKNFLIWDDILKAGEMTFFSKKVPLQSPSIDFCCGYGFWTSKILQNIDLGVDFFPEYGGYNRTIEGFVNHDFIDNSYNSVLRADVTKEMPLPDSYFNSIISVCSLEHIENVESVLNNMVRILKPGGKIFLSLQTDKYIKKFEEVFNPNYVKWVRDEFAIQKDRDWKTWIQILEAAGLVIEEKQFVLSESEMELKALTYWKNPFEPVFGKLDLENLIREDKYFRDAYFEKVKKWSSGSVSPDEAAIICLTCGKK